MGNIDPFGRKKTIMFSSLVFILGGILQAVAQNVSTMLAGRFIAGCKLLQITLRLSHLLNIVHSGSGSMFCSCTNVHCRNCSTSFTWSFGYFVAVSCRVGYHVVVLVCDCYLYASHNVKHGTNHFLNK